jgi:serine/threonine protein kinase
VRAGEQVAGRYRLDERLGHGGVGEVWRAHDPKLGRPIALKVLLEFDPADDVLERFRREASIGAQFQHPGITVVHDIGQHEDRLFIVMELLRGEDLARVLARAPAGLPVAEAVGLVGQVADALTVAHERGVVHRDLKPANLFRLVDGRLKICDFGIARFMQASAWKVTGPGWILGTPPYMAPEQWRGEGIGIATDVYALGCVFYELLTGAPPFRVQEQDEPLALRHRHFDHIPEPLRSIRPEIPGELEAVVAAMLAKTQAARPDAPTVAARLREIADLVPEPAPDLHTAPTRVAAPSAPPPLEQLEQAPAPAPAADLELPGPGIRRDLLPTASAPADPAPDPSPIPSPGRHVAGRRQPRERIYTALEYR